MESVHNNVATRKSSADVGCKHITDHNNMDPSFMALSFMTEEYMMEELNTVNDSVLEDYSQVNHATPTLPGGNALSHPTMYNLNLCLVFLCVTKQI